MVESWHFTVRLLIISVTAVCCLIMDYCPSSCNCHPTGNGRQTVTCELSNPEDYGALSQVPSRTVALTCLVSGAFRDDLVHFGKVALLERLNFTSIGSNEHTNQVSEFVRCDIFRNLTKLQALIISLPLNSFNPRLLTPLGNLKLVEFSHTYMLEFVDFVNIMKTIGTNVTQLEELNLIAIQSAMSLDTTIRLRDHIFENLKDHPLKVLDLSDNKAVLVQQGLTKYLPQLEIFRVSSSGWMNFEFTSSLACYLADIFLHQNLREYVISFPTNMFPRFFQDYVPMFTKAEKDRKRNVVYDYTYMPRTKLSYTYLCDVINTVCQPVAMHPCEEHGHSLSFLITSPMERLYRNSGYCLPVPPRLEIFVFGIYFQPLTSESYRFCLDQITDSPSNVRFLEVSGSRTVSTIIRVSAMEEPRYLNVKISGMYIGTFAVRAIFNMTSLEVLRLVNFTRLPMYYHDYYLDYEAKILKMDFSRHTNLVVLELENEGITDIPINCFLMLKKLEVLTLSWNHLSDLNVNISDLNHLKLVNLTGNDIYALGEYIRNQLDTVHYTEDIRLDLVGNPLKCSCENISFVQWLQSTSIQFARKNAVRCSHPTLSYISPWDVSVDELRRQCVTSNFDVIVSSLLSAARMSVIVTAVVIFHRRRWRIRYWLHAVRESLRQRRHQEKLMSVANNCVFDAFVAYSSHGEERTWVHTTLREKLENEHGLKLCMYHRDF